MTRPESRSRQNIYFSTLILLFPLISGILFGQQWEEAEKLVKEGVSLEESGKSELAMLQYQKALDLDKDNLMALSEMAYSFLSVEKYGEAITYSKRAIKTRKGDEWLKTVYESYGNALDAMKETGNSIEIYNGGIQLFPDYYQLYFNKGISLSCINKNEEAIHDNSTCRSE